MFFFGGEADKPIEFVSFRMGLAAASEGLAAAGRDGSAHRRSSSPSDSTTIVHWQDGQLKSRAALKLRDRVPGPALLEDPTSTLYVPAGWQARRDANDNTILERK